MMRDLAGFIVAGLCSVGAACCAEDFAPTIYRFPTAGVVEIYVDLSKHSKAGEISHISATLASREGKRLCFGDEASHGAKAKLKFTNYAQVPPGDYVLAIRALDRVEQPVYAARSAFTRPPAPPWLNNKLGAEDTVPPPWSAVKVVDNTVVTWNRKYVFGPLGLPTSLVSAGGDLLGQPIRLVARVNGRPVAFAATKPLRSSAGPTKAIVTSEAAASDSPAVKLTIATTVEFDGFSRVDLQLTGTSAESLDRFWLEIPMTRPNALYHLPVLPSDPTIPSAGFSAPVVHQVYFFDLPGYVVGSRPPGHERDHGTYMDGLFWVGGDDRGLIWAAESDRDWLLPDRWKAQTLSLDGDNLIWRLHFVDDMPRNMAKPLSLTYCFQVTPVRPVADWYGLRLAGGAAEYIDLRGSRHPMLQAAHDAGVKVTGVHEHWTEAMSYPGTTTHHKELAALMAEAKRLGMNICLYSSTWLSALNPEMAEWSGEWLQQIPATVLFHRTPADSGVPHQDVYGGRHTESWTDFYLYHTKKMIHDYGINGFYLDGTYGPGISANPYDANAHCVGGVPQAVSPIFAARDFMKRWYRMAKALDPNFFFWGHVSCSEYFMPTVGFTDYTMGGEDFFGVPDGFEIPWAYMRAVNTGRQFGPVREVYCTTKTQEPYMIPLGLVHGVSVLGYNTPDRGLFNAYKRPTWRVWEAFGVGKAQWTPYWKNSPHVHSSDPDVKVSYYTRPGQVLLAAATNRRHAPTAKITLDLAGLGLNPSRLSVKAALGGPIDVRPDSDGKLRLNFPDQANVGGYVWLTSDAAEPVGSKDTNGRKPPQ
jgi:hypothetical protein